MAAGRERKEDTEPQRVARHITRFVDVQREMTGCGSPVVATLVAQLGGLLAGEQGRPIARLDGWLENMKADADAGARGVEGEVRPLAELIKGTPVPRAAEASLDASLHRNFKIVRAGSRWSASPLVSPPRTRSSNPAHEMHRVAFAIHSFFCALIALDSTGVPGVLSNIARLDGISEHVDASLSAREVVPDNDADRQMYERGRRIRMVLAQMAVHAKQYLTTMSMPHDEPSPEMLTAAHHNLLRVLYLMAFTATPKLTVESFRKASTELATRIVRRALAASSKPADTAARASVLSILSRDLLKGDIAAHDWDTARSHVALVVCAVCFSEQAETAARALVPELGPIAPRTRRALVKFLLRPRAAWRQKSLEYARDFLCVESGLVLDNFGLSYTL